MITYQTIILFLIAWVSIGVMTIVSALMHEIEMVFVDFGLFELWIAIALIFAGVLGLIYVLFHSRDNYKYYKSIYME